MLTDICLPSEPDEEHSLNSATFLAEHYENMQNVISNFGSSRCIDVDKCHMFNENSVKSQLSQIKLNFDVPTCKLY